MPGTASGRQLVRRDIVAERTVLVSDTPAGTPGDDDSSSPRISDAGTRVAFTTGSVNLGADGSDPPEVDNRYVLRDLAANTLEIVSRFDGPAGAPQVSFGGAISADGTKVGWTDGHGDRFYIRDPAAGTTVEASQGPDGGRLPGFCCYSFELSRDGRYVAAYAGGEAADSKDYLAYHRDTIAGVTQVVSRPAGPGGAPAPSHFDHGVAISDDGRFVAFGSTSTALSDFDFRGPTPGEHDSDIFVRDVLGPPPPTLITDPPVPPPPAVADLPAVDREPPVLSRLSLTRKRFRVGRQATPLSAAKRNGRRRAAAGTQIRFRLSEAATVSIGVQRRTAGLRLRRAGRMRCLRATARNRTRLRAQLRRRRAIARLDGRARRAALRRATRRSRCRLWVRRGSLVRSGDTGANSVRFSGRIGRRALPRGRYRFSLTARDAAGNRSRPPRRTAFRIVR